MEQDWSELKNGDLLDQAEMASYDVFITTDQNFKYQQNLTNRKIGIPVLTSASWPKISAKVEEIRKALDDL